MELEKHVRDVPYSVRIKHLQPNIYVIIVIIIIIAKKNNFYVFFVGVKWN